MVKRLRRRPLTAESGVRFPLRLPMRKNCASAIDLHSANRLAEALVFSLTRANRKC